MTEKTLVLKIEEDSGVDHSAIFISEENLIKLQLEAGDLVILGEEGGQRKVCFCFDDDKCSNDSIRMNNDCMENLAVYEGNLLTIQKCSEIFKCSAATFKLADESRLDQKRYKEMLLELLSQQQPQFPIHKGNWLSYRDGAVEYRFVVDEITPGSFATLTPQTSIILKLNESSQIVSKRKRELDQTDNHSVGSAGSKHPRSLISCTNTSSTSNNQNETVSLAAGSKALDSKKANMPPHEFLQKKKRRRLHQLSNSVQNKFSVSMSRLSELLFG